MKLGALLFIAASVAADSFRNDREAFPTFENFPVKAVDNEPRPKRDPKYSPAPAPYSPAPYVPAQSYAPAPPVYHEPAAAYAPAAPVAAYATPVVHAAPAAAYAPAPAVAAYTPAATYAAAPATYGYAGQFVY